MNSRKRVLALKTKITSLFKRKRDSADDTHSYVKAIFHEENIPTTFPLIIRSLVGNITQIIDPVTIVTRDSIYNEPASVLVSKVYKLACNYFNLPYHRIRCVAHVETEEGDVECVLVSQLAERDVSIREHLESKAKHFKNIANFTVFLF